jgi:hypothetical protein
LARRWAWRCVRLGRRKWWWDMTLDQVSLRARARVARLSWHVQTFHVQSPERTLF